jgi:hypothetical protein
MFHSKAKAGFASCEDVSWEAVTHHFVAHKKRVSRMLRSPTRRCNGFEENTMRLPFPLPARALFGP